MLTLIFSLVCLAVVVGIPGGFYWFYQNEKNSKKYGPPELLGGSPNSLGTLVWVSGRSVLLGSEEEAKAKRKQENHNRLQLVQQGDELTGQFKGSAINGRPYEGEVYLSCRQGKLEGRYSMRSRETSYSAQIVHGVLGQKEAHLFLGVRRDGKKYSNQLQVQMSDQELNWQARRGKIQKLFLAASGRLQINQNQLTGRVPGYREPQSMDVEVAHRAEKPELVWIATLLCCSEILRMQ